MKSYYLVLFILGCFAHGGYTQSRKFSGLVLDSSNDAPLKNVNIQLVGTASGTFTNERGEFDVTISEPRRTGNPFLDNLADTHLRIKKLLISRIGYLTKEVTLSSASKFVVKLDKEYVHLSPLYLHDFPKEEVPYAPPSIDPTPSGFVPLENFATYGKGLNNFRIQLGNVLFSEDQKGIDSLNLIFTIDETGKPTNLRATPVPPAHVIDIIGNFFSGLTPWTPATQRNEKVQQHFEISIVPGVDPLPSKDFYSYIISNLFYPKAAWRKGTQGFVEVEFSIGSPGNNIDQVRIVKDIGNGCGDEVKRVLFATPSKLCLGLVGAAKADKFILPVFFGSNEPKKNPATSFSGAHYPLMRVLILMTPFQGQASYYKPKRFSMHGLTSDEISTGMFGQWTYSNLYEAIRDRPVAKRLALRQNMLSSFPPEILTLKKLEFLDLEGNAIESLPEEIIALKKLRWLFLPFNKITDLPPTLGELSKLELLGLADNKLETIPAPVFFLKKLTGLDLAGNNITTIPRELYSLKKLKTLVLTNNPIDIKEIEALKSNLPNTQVIF